MDSFNSDISMVIHLPKHYFLLSSIKAVPAGVSKSTKKLLQSKIPDLSKYEDISDFMLKWVFN